MSILPRGCRYREITQSLRGVFCKDGACVVVVKEAKSTKCSCAVEGMEDEAADPGASNQPQLPPKDLRMLTGVW